MILSEVRLKFIHLARLCTLEWRPLSFVDAVYRPIDATKGLALLGGRMRPLTAHRWRQRARYHQRANPRWVVRGLVRKSDGNDASS
jgi:hypothetical protein